MTVERLGRVDSVAGHPRCRSLVVIAVAALLFASCSRTDASLPSAMVEAFASGASVGDLSVTGTEELDIGQLAQADARARSIGTTLRVAVVDADVAPVSAAALVDRFGGTALSYQANGASFEVASADIAVSQLERALTRAQAEENIGDSVDAFLAVVDEEGIDPPTSSWWVWIAAGLLALSLLFVLVQALRFRAARSRRIRKESDQSQRQVDLSSWANQLAEQLAESRGAALAQPAIADQWVSLDKTAAELKSTVLRASNASDLDAVEMRLGGAFRQLRTMQASLRR